jgi:hypothetical protein
VPFADDLALDQLLLKFMANTCSPVAAHAHEPDTAVGKSLNRLDSDLVCETSGNHRPFIHGKIDGAAHDVMLRWAETWWR